MALHFHRIPIVLSARSLRKVVNFYKESAKNVEYRADNEDIESCNSTTALLKCSILRINEAKEDLQKLYREILDDYRNCENNSEKREILAEIHQITEESELHISIAEANDLIAILAAKLNEFNKIQENMENRLECTKTRAQKVCAPAKDDSEIVQNVAENTEQSRSYVSMSSFSQAPYSNQHRDGPMAVLEKEIATNAYTETRLGQKNNGRVKQSRAKRPNYRPNYGDGCIFCHKGNHSSTRCRTVSDQSMRRKALKEQNRCWKCFSRTHSSWVCRKQDCSFCGQKHHISLCFKKDKTQSNCDDTRQSRDMPPNHSDRKGCQNCGQRSDRSRYDCRKHTSINAQMCMDNFTKLHSRTVSSINKQTVLMTAEGSIWNAKRRQFEKVLFCFDSGSQKTVVEEKLVEQFGLPKKRTKMCTVSGSGGHMETCKSHIIPLKVGTAFGQDIDMTVETRPVITSGFPSVKLGQADAEFLKANDIYLASTKIRGERQIPRVLVGLDYYHDLVTGHVTKTPSGLHIARTVFGPTIYGSGLTEVNHVESVNYNLTAVWESTEVRAPQKGSGLGVLETRAKERKRCKKLSKYSDTCKNGVCHAYRFTPTSFPLKEDATHVVKNHSVVMKRLQSSQLQPSAFKSSRQYPTSSRLSRRPAAVRLQLLPPVVALHVLELCFAAVHLKKSILAAPRRQGRKPRSVILIVIILVVRRSIIDKSMILAVSMFTADTVPPVEGAELTRLGLEILVPSQNDVVSPTRRTLLTILLALTLYCTLHNKYPLNHRVYRTYGQEKSKSLSHPRTLAVVTAPVYYGINA